MTFCKKRLKPDLTPAWHGQVLQVNFDCHLCRERRCRSWLRWSGRRCSPGRIRLCNRGYSCTFRYLPECRRHRTPRFHDTAFQSLPRKLWPTKPKTLDNTHSFLKINLQQNNSSVVKIQKKYNTHSCSLVQMFLLGSRLWWSQCRTTCADLDVLFSCIVTADILISVFHISDPTQSGPPLKQHMHITVPRHTSWTTKLQNALRALLPCGCTRSCCFHTDPPQSP